MSAMHMWKLKSDRLFLIYAQLFRSEQLSLWVWLSIISWLSGRRGSRILQTTKQPGVEALCLMLIVCLKHHILCWTKQEHSWWNASPTVDFQ